MDDVRFFSNSELRCLIRQLRACGQFVKITDVAFVDVGRVWPGLGDFRLSDPHASAGGGLRFVLNRDFTMWIEAVRSREQNSAIATMDRHFYIFTSCGQWKSAAEST